MKEEAYVTLLFDNVKMVLTIMNLIYIDLYNITLI